MDDLICDSRTFGLSFVDNFLLVTATEVKVSRHEGLSDWDFAEWT